MTLETYLQRFAIACTARSVFTFPVDVADQVDRPSELTAKPDEQA